MNPTNFKEINTISTIVYDTESDSESDVLRETIIVIKQQKKKKKKKQNL